MKVSMVIPAFNEQRLLLRSLLTIEPQKDELHECIVVDDGSEPPLKVPSWVTLQRITRPMEHRGSSAAKNVGATFATGDWLLFADSDFLHQSDAIASIKEAAAFFAEHYSRKLIVNTLRFEIPKDYPEFNVHRLDEYLELAQREGFILDLDLKNPKVRSWEQNFSMIPRDFFWAIGGYDADTFRSWGFNNHDLCLRVIQAGGYVTSTVRRRTNGKRLICVHQYHDNGVSNRDQANKEFASKWGQPFYHTMAQDLFGRTLEDYTACPKS